MADKTQLQPPANTDPAGKNPDSQAMRGGPGQEDSPGAEAQVEVTRGGVKFLVNPDVADAMQQHDTDREAQFNRRLNESSEELGQLRKEARDRVTPPADDDRRAPAGGGGDDDERDALFLHSPTKMVNIMLDEREQKVRSDMRAESATDRAQEKWWGKFWRTHPDLDAEEDQFLVNAVMLNQFSELKGLDEEASIKKVGELTRSKILAVSKRINTGDDPPPGGRDRLEAGGTQGPGDGGRPAPRPARTATQGLKDRKAKRSEARAGRDRSRKESKNGRFSMAI